MLRTILFYMRMSVLHASVYVQYMCTTSMEVRREQKIPWSGR